MRHLGSTRLLTFLLVTLSLALPLRISAQAGVASPDDGYVSEGSYVNKFFNFTYTLPSGLTPQSKPAFNKRPNTPSGHFAKTFILLLAATPVKPYKNIAISAQTSADFKDGGTYLHKVSASAVRNGLSVLSDPDQQTLAGKSFFRQDYYAPQGAFYQTHVCTIYEGYALDFVISAANREDVDQLFDSLKTLQFGTVGR